ncbi:MAG: GspD family T2SS secretin variant LspD [Legionellaceae bacterium]|nr:GspD family T2SS secretin variant LspD [Legionellaceae bacterium]
MRIYFYLLLSYCLTSVVFASEVTIRTVSIDGQDAYVIHAGAFAHKKNADELQKKISDLSHMPVELQYLPEKKLWLVKTAPLNDYNEALELQNKIRDQKQEARQFGRQGSPGKKLWNLKNADIRAVIAEVSRLTGKNFIIDPRVQGKISIVSATPISDDELYQVFLSMLQISGYAAIDNGDITKIVPNIDAKTQSPDISEADGHPPLGDEMLVQVIPVKYVPADQLVPVLRPLMPQWSSISAYNPSNMLILSGRANNIRQLATIITQVDDSTSSDIDIVPLKYALAMDIANTLKDLVKSVSGPGKQPTTLAPDDRSNAILISGNKTDRIRLRMLINRLDQESSRGVHSNTQVIYLNYLRAEDLVPILAGIAEANFSGIVGTTIGSITKPELDSTNPASSMASGSSSTNLQSGERMSSSKMGASMGTSEVSSKTEGSTKPIVQIIAEPNTNSVILNAPPSIISIMRSVISQLDIRPAQLLIEAIVAELDENDVNSLGIEWGSREEQNGRAPDFRPGFAIINSQTSIDNFQAQIYALARNRRANILSSPSVVVLDNRQAKILVGQQVSVQNSSYPNNAGGSTGATPFTTFDRVNVALHLYVRPQITRGQGIQMQIDQGNDTISPTSIENSVNPVFNISSIVTSVHVESGDIVVLGGLSQDSLGNEDNHLPILGDIPGIGRLFQHNIRNREKKVLMVFIKPIILRNKKDALQVTGGKYDHVRNYQLEMLRDQEIYIPDDKELYLPPLHSANLPKPFAAPPPEQKIVTKIIKRPAPRGNMK